MRNWIENLCIFGLNSITHAVQLFLCGQGFNPDSNSSNNIHLLYRFILAELHCVSFGTDHFQLSQHNFSVILNFIEDFTEFFLRQWWEWPNSRVHQIKGLDLINHS